MIYRFFIRLTIWNIIFNDTQIISSKFSCDTISIIDVIAKLSNRDNEKKKSMLLSIFWNELSSMIEIILCFNHWSTLKVVTKNSWLMSKLKSKSKFDRNEKIASSTLMMFCVIFCHFSSKLIIFCIIFCHFSSIIVICVVQSDKSKNFQKLQYLCSSAIFKKKIIFICDAMMTTTSHAKTLLKFYISKIVANVDFIRYW